jgi:DNA polymerase
MPIRKSGHWKMIWLDFETRSTCDLKSRGVYNYAQDLTTEVLCMSYAVDDGEVQTWTTGPLPDFTGHRIMAHNAAFERLICWYVLQVNIPLEFFYCTAAQARANCAPGSLEDVGRFMGASMKKDHRGAALIRKMCVPPFQESAELTAEMIQYCEQDVRAMRAISQAMRPLSEEELADYHVNERINDRGVLVDVPLCRAAVSYAATEAAEIAEIVKEVSKGELTSVRSPKMRQWVWDRVGPEARALMTKDDKVSIDKTVRANLLNCEGVPPDVQEIIQCADDLWASSVAKFARLAQLADEEDSRVRGAFVFAGGSATGRASSYGAQVHNFTRKCAKSPDDVRAAMCRGHAIVPKFGQRVTDVLRGMLRPALIPAKGKHLVVADWSSIEARVNPWLSGTGQAKLDIFESGLDPYIVNAAGTFQRTYDDIKADYDRDGESAQRQIGKVQELACGFAGGVGAFASMARIYSVRLSEADSKRMVDAWRRNNQWAVNFWQQLEQQYTRAMRNKNNEFTAGRVSYLFDGLHLWYSLPSGRVLCYPFARLEDDGISYAKAAWKPAQDAKEWPRARLWRGLACENVTQAVANDLLRYALRQLDGVVLHVHDEIVVEGGSEEEVRRVMTTPPAWATGLPLACGIKTMPRYGK